MNKGSFDIPYKFHFLNKFFLQTFPRYREDVPLLWEYANQAQRHQNVDYALKMPLDVLTRHQKMNLKTFIPEGKINDDTGERLQHK